MNKEDSTFWLALTAAVGTTFVNPLTLVLSQRWSRKAERERQQLEHDARSRTREREFDEERRARLHDARIEAHAGLIRLCDELRGAQRRADETDSAFDERTSELLTQARVRAANVSIYSSPTVAKLADELVWHCYHYLNARRYGGTQIGDSEDPDFLTPDEAWTAAGEGRANYVIAFQAELGVTPS